MNEGVSESLQPTFFEYIFELVQLMLVLDMICVSEVYDVRT